ncbi:ACT domain-containing protein [Rhizobium sp. G21]|uniref:ACT domain-containing protein n=1 Tax=Rhizobium sp. G21 TaxID=2758439 RepID=UPI003917DA42
MMPSVALSLLAGDYAVCRLSPADPIPAWAEGDGFVSISRSDEELSILCRAERAPSDVRQDAGWACLKLQGPFAFDETGIVLSVVAPLSNAGLGIFAVSTFDGDHILVKRAELDRAEALLREAGHRL